MKIFSLLPDSTSPADCSQFAASQGAFARYASRFLVLGSVIALLLCLLFYQYIVKVAAPVAALERDPKTELLTLPAQDFLTPVDSNP
jgi:hypothetical protein